MSNRRSELAEMTALYLIPIVAVVIAASSGGLVAGALPDPQHQLWTLVISYVFWGIGSPLSWIVLTVSGPGSLQPPQLAKVKCFRPISV